MAEIKINNLSKFLETLDDIECLAIFDNITIRHLHDGSEESVNEMHLIADIFLENDLFEKYAYERKHGNDGYIYFHFYRRAK